MHPFHPMSSRAKSFGAFAGTSLLAAALVACGGGGGSPTATVNSTSVAAARYGATALLTIAGTSLDNISVTSAACKDIQRLTTPPTASTSTTAYYGCTVSGAFSGNFTISSNGTVVATSNTFTVPVPQVTLSVTNTQGVNGNIVITLAGDKMPITVDNFLTYVNAGFYSGQIFDRVVAGFVAQGGLYGAAPNGVLGNPKATNAPIPLEINAAMHNVQWSVAMARGTNPNSATAEFYINLVDNSGTLDGNYAVFGNISAGTDVVQAIAAAPAQCTNNPLAGTYDCLPVPNVTISSAMQTQ